MKRRRQRRCPIGRPQSGHGGQTPRTRRNITNGRLHISATCSHRFQQCRAHISSDCRSGRFPGGSYRRGIRVEHCKSRAETLHATNESHGPPANQIPYFPQIPRIPRVDVINWRGFGAGLGRPDPKNLRFPVGPQTSLDQGHIVPRDTSCRTRDRTNAQR